MAEVAKDKRDVWYVEFPTYQYKEDVKALARKADLRIVDAKFQGDKKQCAKAPKLTPIVEPTTSKDEE